MLAINKDQLLLVLRHNHRIDSVTKSKCLLVRLLQGHIERVDSVLPIWVTSRHSRAHVLAQRLQKYQLCRHHTTLATPDFCLTGLSMPKSCRIKGLLVRNIQPIWNYCFLINQSRLNFGYPLTIDRCCVGIVIDIDEQPGIGTKPACYKTLAS